MQNQTLLNTGLQHYRAGEFQAAENNFRQLLNVEPDNVVGLNLLGMLCINSGRAEEAVTLISRALTAKPDDHQALANIGLAYQKCGDMPQAERHLRRALNINPNNPGAWNNLGNIFKDTARHEDAIKCFNQALKRNPDFALCLSNLAHALIEVDKLSEAKAAVSRALALAPDLPEAHYQQGEIFRRTSHYPQAIVAYRAALHKRPDFFEAMLGLATAQRESEDISAAITTLNQLLALKPDHAQAHCSLGIIHEQAGDKEKAVCCFKEAIKLAPDVITPHYQLAQIKGRKSSAAEIAHMEQLKSRPGIDTDESDAAYLYFGLAEAYDKNGEPEKAFAAWQQANAYRAKRFPYLADKRVAYKEDTLKFSKILQEKKLSPAPQADKPRLIFVMGMPRSGTSLTDQILASHSAVTSIGEVSLAYDMSNQIATITGTAYPKGLSDLKQSQLETLAADYMARINESASNAPWVLDKTPMNFQCLGLLAEAFPDALFIHCQRDPMDNLFSIFKLPFAHNQEYSHSLEALAHNYKLYQAMMDEWQALYGDRILDVKYEDTVADIAAQTTRMVNFIGLDFEDQMLSFFKTERQVRTPSASQVRQPIYKDSVQAWKRYEQQLQPLVNYLGQ